MFQVCLAAAVANLTLLAATSEAFTTGGMQAGEVLILLLVTVVSLFVTVALATGAVGSFTYLDHLIRPWPRHPATTGHWSAAFLERASRPTGQRDAVARVRQLPGGPSDPAEAPGQMLVIDR